MLHPVKAFYVISSLSTNSVASLSKEGKKKKGNSLGFAVYREVPYSLQQFQQHSHPLSLQLLY